MPLSRRVRAFLIGVGSLVDLDGTATRTRLQNLLNEENEMPSKTADIETAISMVVDPGDELTLAELDTRLYAAYPQLHGEDRRWIGVAVSTMIRDGRLLADDPDGAYTEKYVIRRPA